MIAEKQQPGAVQGAARRDQAGDQGRVELMFKVEVESVQTVTQKGKDQALRPFDRPPRPRQEGVCALKAGQELNFSGEAA
jgi:ribosomal protein L23